MMELIKYIDEFITDMGPELDIDVLVIRKKAQQLLEKEKKQIVDACYEQIANIFIEYDNGEFRLGYDAVPEEIYNQTYLKEVENEAK